MQSDYRPFDRQPDKPSLVFQIALGVFLGTLAASAVIWAGFEFRLRWEMEKTSAMLQDQARQAQHEIDKSNERNRQRALADQAAREQAIREATDQQRAAEDRRQAVLAETNRREAAWTRFYKPSPGCAFASQSIECSNEFIRAKSSFDQKYSEGAL